jgi:hypothetical protein
LGSGYIDTFLWPQVNKPVVILFTKLIYNCINTPCRIRELSSARYHQMRQKAGRG